MLKQQQMIDFLTRHGFTHEELNIKDTEEIKSLYLKSIQKQIEAFIPIEEHTPFSDTLPSNPFHSLKSPQEIYNLNLNFIPNFHFEDLIFHLQKQFSFIPIEKIQKMLQILTASLQEKILGEIKINLANIPKEDQDFILDIYERQKENLTHLARINQQLNSQEFREKFENILKLKNTIAQSKPKTEES